MEREAVLQGAVVFAGRSSSKCSRTHYEQDAASHAGSFRHGTGTSVISGTTGYGRNCTRAYIYHKRYSTYTHYANCTRNNVAGG